MRHDSSRTAREVVSSKPLSESVSSSSSDEFKGHSLLQAAREADVAKVKKTLTLEIIGFKHPQSNETALVRSPRSPPAARRVPEV